MKTLDLSQKLLRDVMWRLPKEDWDFAEDVAWRLQDLHHRVKLLESVLMLEKEYHASRGEANSAQTLQEILDDGYMRGET